jgi:hypothetical protein
MWADVTLIVEKEKHNRGVDGEKQKKTFIFETREKNGMGTVSWLPNYVLRNTSTLYTKAS